MFGEQWLSRVDRISVWVLFFLIFVHIFTGFGMTKQLMDPVLAKYIHTQILPLPLLIVFFIHILKPVRKQFKSWNIFKSERALDGYVYALAVILLSLIVWLYFR